MKNIEIITTQNVVLQYELATLQDRIFAFILDMIILLISLSMLSAFVTAIFQSESAGVLFVTCLFCFYSLAFECFNNGRSLGKMAMRIQVIKLSGGKATFSDYA